MTYPLSVVEQHGVELGLGVKVTGCHLDDARHIVPHLRPRARHQHQHKVTHLETQYRNIGKGEMVEYGRQTIESIFYIKEI